MGAQLPKSLTQPFRQGQLTVGSGWRGYFAPFNQASAVNQTSTAIGPSMYDLEVFGPFLDSAPPAGWADLGLIRNFRFTPGSKIGSVVSGYRGAVRAKYRGEVGEKFNFSFAEMTRMAMRLATGSQVFNLLDPLPAAIAGDLGPVGTPGASGVTMTSYSATGPSGATLVMSGPIPGLVVGDMIVCDVDYVPGDFGFVGAAGANVFPGAVTQPDFIRKTSDFVAGVKAISANTLVLTGPFIGGGNQIGTDLMGPTVPPAGSKVQKIKGYASREGGTYIAVWSAVFVLSTIDASQILLYYPRVSPDAFGGINEVAIQNISSLQEQNLEASFEAMAYDDPLDGETVVRYSAYFPHKGTNPAG
jgi:hypothetical protein